MLKIAVLGSTQGTDLQTILDAISDSRLTGVNIEFVLSNRSKSGILDRARKHGIKDIFLSGKGKTRGDYDREIHQLLVDHQVQLVLLIGYMKLMTPWFVSTWLNRVVNVHPSLLPAFAGGMDLNVHQEVLNRGCKISGATLIFIDQGADTGPIISQKITSVSPTETVSSLKLKIQDLEGELLVDLIQNFRDDLIRVVRQDTSCLGILPETVQKLRNLETQPALNCVINLTPEEWNYLDRSVSLFVSVTTPNRV